MYFATDGSFGDADNLVILDSEIVGMYFLYNIAVKDLSDGMRHFLAMQEAIYRNQTIV